MATKVLHPRVEEHVFENVREIAEFLQVPIGTAAGIVLSDYFGSDDARLAQFWDSKFSPPEPPRPTPEEPGYYSQKGLVSLQDSGWLKGQLEKRSNGQ